MDDHVLDELAMSLAEIWVIPQLSKRVDVLPVITHADSLRDNACSAIKAAVRRGLRGVGIDFGVFSTPMSKQGNLSSQN